MTGGSIIRHINGKEIGRWSLRFDAGYCTLLGAAVALFSGQIAQGVALPAPLIATVGIAVVVWTGGIAWMLARLPLRFVMVANILAALVVGVTSATSATLLIMLAVVTVAIEITLFAASQAVALRALCL